MEGCTHCGRVPAAPGVALADCIICGNTGVPDPLTRFPAGPRAPLALRWQPRIMTEITSNIRDVREFLDTARHNAIIELNESSRLLTKLGAGNVHN